MPDLSSKVWGMGKRGPVPRAGGTPRVSGDAQLPSSQGRDAVVGSGCGRGCRSQLNVWAAGGPVLWQEATAF